MPAASRDPAKPRPRLDGLSSNRRADGCGSDVLANALIVLEDAILHGRLAMEDGLIAEIRASGDEVPRGAADLSGDLLIRGLMTCTPTTWSGTTSRGQTSPGTPSWRSWRTTHRSSAPGSRPRSTALPCPASRAVWTVPPLSARCCMGLGSEGLLILVET
jgi:hypothetical protein